MVPFIIIVLILLAVGALGAVVKGLLWLTLIAALLIVGAMVYGWFKVKGTSRA